MENKDNITLKTSLYDQHVNLNAKMVDFANYLMPINYDKGIKYEYESVRSDVGVFDVSHMGIFKIAGVGANLYLDRLLSNDISSLNHGEAIYTLLCNDKGGVIDDLIAYRIKDEYILIVNASNKTKDFHWLCNHKDDNVEINDISDSTSLLAVQGPNSRDKLEEMFNLQLSDLNFYQCKEIQINNESFFIARTGYTGELGFEILGKSEAINSIWDVMINSNISPAGLAVRDVLRIEMGYCLYGHEISENVNPLDASLNWIIKKDRDFIGSNFIFNELSQNSKLIFIKMIDRGIPREGFELFQKNQKIGKITSGTFSYNLGIGVGIASIKKNIDNYSDISIDIRGKKYKVLGSNSSFLNNTSLRK